jgi:hypothetical protein
MKRSTVALGAVLALLPAAPPPPPVLMLLVVLLASVVRGCA